MTLEEALARIEELEEDVAELEEANASLSQELDGMISEEFRNRGRYVPADQRHFRVVYVPESEIGE